MRELSKEEGMLHVERCFDKYSQWMSEDLTLFKQCLLDTMKETEIYRTLPAVYYYNLAIDGFKNQVKRFMDEVIADRLAGEAEEILNSKP